MNLLFYINRYPGYGGIENVTQVLANWFVGQVDSVWIYSFCSQDKKNLLCKLSPKIHFIEAVNGEASNSEPNVLQLREILIKEKINVIIHQDSYAPIEACLYRAKKGLCCKLITVEHNSPICFLSALKYDRVQSKFLRLKLKLLYPYYYYKMKRFITVRHKRLYKKSDKYLLLSSKFIPEFKQLVPFASYEKLSYINNPITIEYPEKTDFIKEKICLFCGRLVSQKGIQYLMDIWKRVERLDNEWKLIIVGDGAERPYIEEQIRRNHLCRIMLEGYQSDVIRYYRTASILCMCSTYEGWPLSLGESMAYGCIPILFNSYASASDIIDSGKTGILIEPFNVNDYVKQLMNLIKDNLLREQMSKDAIFFSKKFSEDIIGQQWLKLLTV